MKFEQLYGIWHLVSIYAENANGDRNYYFGQDVSGRLTYLPNGYMSAFIMSNGRSQLSETLTGTLEEIKGAFESFDAYSGTYSVDSTSKTVTHHVDVARLPAYVGNDLVRYFSLEDDVLSILTPPYIIEGEEWIIYANWEKRD